MSAAPSVDALTAALTALLWGVETETQVVRGELFAQLDTATRERTLERALWMCQSEGARRIYRAALARAGDEGADGALGAVAEILADLREPRAASDVLRAHNQGVRSAARHIIAACAHPVAE